MNEEELIREIVALRKTLREKKDTLRRLQRDKHVVQECGLTNEEIGRYSRQILVPEIGVKGQLKLKKSSVLIVGAGGLGCPAALYLVGAGIGHIGIIDYDEVEINNLHRQLLHSEESIRVSKVVSATAALTRLNSSVNITPYKMQLDSSNALGIVKQYDVILDATDNVATRYLLNDACVLTGKPLVSGSALKFEGQLTVYNYRGPCYRCVFPTPPPPETVTNCGDGGVLGAAVGTIGVLQALEAMKIILEMSGVLAGRLLLFDGTETLFRNVKLRPKNQNCLICGDNSTIDKLIDYEEFCRAKANDKNPGLKLLKESERLSVKEYHKFADSSATSHVLIDVRSHEEFEICKLPNSINVPFTQISKPNGHALVEQVIRSMRNGDTRIDVIVICRRGNDSQKAVKILKGLINDEAVNIRDVIGGIHAWAKNVDPTFPIY
ncbi:adenylyltransferase and sulfurtransferase MOCS3 [Neodiprion lecontei]|uniref:Adenylyltransferase and sulfurtransferase MOCS3 homolog n=1 Tax=Neodiprion lecontei TaxID=441921 RepID=A0A6J0BCJ3_NEOLC|nr:adenylyltransferase and sulfurtransferase MOCS3 [Neodiprion lecontei]